MLLVAVAAGIRYTLTPIVGSLTPLLFFTLAQVAAASTGGPRSGTSGGRARDGGRLLSVPAAGQDACPERTKPTTYSSTSASASRLIWMADGMHRSRNEARRSEAELRASHQRMSDLLARIGDPFFSFDLEWKCLYANPRAAALIGQGRCGPRT